MSEKRLNHIEETLAHQEQLINDLNQIIVKQWDEIDMLKARLTNIHNKVELLEADNAASEDDALSATEIAARDKPPHY